MRLEYQNLSIPRFMKKTYKFKVWPCLSWTLAVAFYKKVLYIYIYVQYVHIYVYIYMYICIYVYIYICIVFSQRLMGFKISPNFTFGSAFSQNVIVNSGYLCKDFLAWWLLKNIWPDIYIYIEGKITIICLIFTNDRVAKIPVGQHLPTTDSRDPDAASEVPHGAPSQSGSWRDWHRCPDFIWRIRHQQELLGVTMDGCLNWEMRIHDSQLVYSCVCLLCVYICVCNIYSCRQITHNKYVFKPYQSCLMKVTTSSLLWREIALVCRCCWNFDPPEPTFGSTKNFTLHHCVEGIYEDFWNCQISNTPFVAPQMEPEVLLVEWITPSARLSGM